MHVKVLNVKFYVKMLAQLGNKALVAITLVATKMEIAMSSTAVIAQLEQHPQKRHGVSPTTQCHKHRARGIDAAIAIDECLDFIKKTLFHL